MATFNGTSLGEILWAHSDADVIRGFAGNDIIYGNNGDDSIYGGEDGDTIYGGWGADRLEGEEGNDALDGEGGPDWLHGGAGDDVIGIYLGYGPDTLDGGTGNDTLQISATRAKAPQSFSFSARGSWDGSVWRDMEALSWFGSVYGDSVTGGEKNDYLDGFAGDDVLHGEGGSDYFLGYLGNDQLYGGDGDDRLYGDSGSDLLDGGAGNDSMTGGGGADIFIVDSPGDIAVEYEEPDTDAVRSSVSYTLSPNIERLTLTGSQSINGTGNTESNLIEGNSSANVLEGMAGVDTLIGGAGDDSYRVDQTSDTVIEALGEGTDTVIASADFTLPLNVEVLKFDETAGGFPDLKGTGNELDNLLTGNDVANLLSGLGGDDILEGSGGNDTLQGGNGNDTLQGGEGNDALSGDNGADSLIGGAGNDTYVVSADDTVVEASGGGRDTVKSAVSCTLGANLEKLVLTGMEAENGNGNFAANALIGNAAANVLAGFDNADMLLGQGGDDVLIGGKGNDNLAGGAGADTFQFDTTLNKTTNKDTITDFGADDLIHLDDDIFTAFDADASTTLNASAFRSGDGVTTAADADDRILYDTATGTLYYDGDGSGTAKAAVAFAVLGATNHPTITAADFVIVA